MMKTSFKKMSCFMATAMVLSAPVAVYAEDTESSSELPEWLDSIQIHSFLSLGYVYNFNDPASNMNSQRFFDFKHNQFRVDDFQFSVLREAAEPGDAGFRFDLDVGSNITRTIHSAGLLEGEDVDVRQAFVSYIAPLGNGLTIDFGKFITAFGLEVIEGWEGFNDNYSHSYDFSFAIPFTHTGLRLSYPVNDKLSLMFMAVNGGTRWMTTTTPRDFTVRWVSSLRKTFRFGSTTWAARNRMTTRATGAHCLMLSGSSSHFLRRCRI